MPTIDVLLLNAVLLTLLVCSLWGISLVLQNASIVDVFWGAGFVVVCWVSVLAHPEVSGRAIIVVALVSVWGGRLALFLGWRNFGKGEDHRYAAMRQRRPRHFWIWSLLWVFLLQGFLIWVISLPLQLIPRYALPLNGLDLVAGCVWLVGWTFEAVGDWQLARFKADPSHQGQVMQSGLWRYTRHPNYFGDFLVWWSYFAFAIATGHLWWTVFCPLVMTWLLLRVSGVSLLEQSITSRRPGYAEYQERTNAFFPWPPKQ